MAASKKKKRIVKCAWCHCPIEVTREAKVSYPPMCFKCAYAIYNTDNKTI